MNHEAERVQYPLPRRERARTTLLCGSQPLLSKSTRRIVIRRGSSRKHRASVVPPNTPFRNAIFHLVEKPQRVAVPVTRKHGGVGRVDQAKRCENSQNLSPAKRAIEEQANAA